MYFIDEHYRFDIPNVELRKKISEFLQKHEFRGVFREEDNPLNLFKGHENFWTNSEGDRCYIHDVRLDDSGTLTFSVRDNFTTDYDNSIDGFNIVDELANMFGVTLQGTIRYELRERGFFPNMSPEHVVMGHTEDDHRELCVDMARMLYNSLKRLGGISDDVTYVRLQKPIYIYKMKFDALDIRSIENARGFDDRLCFILARDGSGDPFESTHFSDTDAYPVENIPYTSLDCYIQMMQSDLSFMLTSELLDIGKLIKDIDGSAEVGVDVHGNEDIFASANKTALGSMELSGCVDTVMEACMSQAKLDEPTGCNCLVYRDKGFAFPLFPNESCLLDCVSDTPGGDFVVTFRKKDGSYEDDIPVKSLSLEKQLLLCHYMMDACDFHETFGLSEGLKIDQVVTGGDQYDRYVEARNNIQSGYSYAKNTGEPIAEGLSKDFAMGEYWSRGIDFVTPTIPGFQGLRYKDYKDCTNVYCLFQKTNFAEAKAVSVDALKCSELMAVSEALSMKLRQVRSKGPKI